MKATSLEQTVELTETDFIEIYRSLKSMNSEGLQALQDILTTTDTYRGYGFIVRYFMDASKGTLNYKLEKKNPIGYK